MNAQSGHGRRLLPGHDSPTAFSFRKDQIMASDNQMSQEKKQGKSNRGFASMDPQRQREIASEGGRAAHEKGTAHEFTSEEAREAGRKGGQARSESNRARKSSSSAGLNGSSNQSGGSDSDR
jgi:uncharacterized protein